MNNCLVKKLVCEVDNQNLPFFDALPMKFKFSEESAFVAIDINYGDSMQAVITSGNGYFHGGGTTHTFTGRQSGEYANRDYVSIYRTDDKPITIQFLDASSGKFKGFYGNATYVYEIDLNQVFKYSPAFKEIRIGSGTCILDDFSKVPETVTLFYFGNKQEYMVGSINDFANRNHFLQVSLAGDNITGDIVSFSKCTSMITLGTFQSKISGSIESLAAGMVANGRTSGTLTLFVGGGDAVTYNGNVYPDFKQITVTFNSSVPNGYTISA